MSKSNTSEDESPRLASTTAPTRRKKEFVIEFGQVHVGIPMSDKSDSQESPKKKNAKSPTPRTIASSQGSEVSSSKSPGSTKMEQIESSSNSFSKSPSISVTSHSHSHSIPSHESTSASMLTSSSTTSPTTSSVRREPMIMSPLEYIRSIPTESKSSPPSAANSTNHLSSVPHQTGSSQATMSTSIRHLPTLSTSSRTGSSESLSASSSSQSVQHSSSQSSVQQSSSGGVKKKRLIISVGSAKIGSIYFGKKEKKRSEKPLTIPEVQVHYQTDGSHSRSNSNSSYRTTTSTSSSSGRSRASKNKLRRKRENLSQSSSNISNVSSTNSTNNSSSKLNTNAAILANNMNVMNNSKLRLSPSDVLLTDPNDITEQSINFSGLEVRSDQSGKDLTRSQEIVTHFHSMLKSSRGLISDLRRRDESHNSISTFALPDESKQKIKSHLIEITLNPYESFYEIIEDFKRQPELTSLLPPTYGTINLITNMPIEDNLVNTPRTDVTPKEKAYVSELSLLLMSSVLHSCPYINEDEKSGTVIQNVIPIPGKEREISGSGSLLQFNWHTENVHEEHPAEFLMLLCLRGDKNAFTSFMLIEDILNGLDEDFKQQLLTTKFLMKTGPSYHKEKHSLRTILTIEKDGNCTIVYNSDIARCCPQDDFGKKVYTDFQNYLENSVPSYAISLEPGEAVIIKNREAMHKRDGFIISTTDEERRWLQRVYLKSPKYLHHKGKPTKL